MKYMINATYKDKDRVIEILTSSFASNLSVNYIVKQDADLELRIRGLMEYAFKVCMAFGKVVLEDDRNACALVLFPDKKGFSLRALAWDIVLLFRVVGLRNASKILRRETLIKKQHPSDRLYYLWFIGVHPAHKGVGIGSDLLTELIADAKVIDRPIYLETSTVKNIPWYQKFGFEVYHEIDIGYNLFFYGFT